MTPIETPAPGASDPPPKNTCSKCGAALSLQFSFPKTPGEPAQQVFECAGCGGLQWIPVPD